MNVHDKVQALRTALIKDGWTADRHGHFKQTSPQGVHYRIKFQSISARFERRIDTTDYAGNPSHAWVRISAIYYSQLQVLITGAVKVGPIFYGV